MPDEPLGALPFPFPADGLRSLATRLGEPEAAVARGLRAGGGAILAGVVGLLPDAAEMRHVFGLATSAGQDPVLPDEAGRVLAGEAGPGAAGARLLSAAFGGRMAPVRQAVARASGLRPESAGVLLEVAAPLVLAALGREVRSGDLDAAGLAVLLAGRSDAILREAPAGIAGLVGISDIPRVAAAAAAAGPRPPAPPRGGRRWSWPAAAGAALLALLFLLTSRGRSPEPVSTTLGDEAVGAMSESAATAAVVAGRLGGPVRRRLADGTEILVPERGVEVRLVGFLEDPNRLVDRTTWFDLDRTSFEPGSADLTPASAAQVAALVAILRAWPDARVKIGAYTDSVGDRGANERLSRDRARALRDAMVARGVERDRIEAEGYGEQFPVADNGTEEGRARNRRIALRVTEK